MYKPGTSQSVVGVSYTAVLCTKEKSKQLTMHYKVVLTIYVTHSTKLSLPLTSRYLKLPSNYTELCKNWNV